MGAVNVSLIIGRDGMEFRYAKDEPNVTPDCRGTGSASLTYWIGDRRHYRTSRPEAVHTRNLCVSTSHSHYIYLKLSCYVINKNLESGVSHTHRRVYLVMELEPPAPQSEKPRLDNLPHRQLSQRGSGPRE